MWIKYWAVWTACKKFDTYLQAFELIYIWGGKCVIKKENYNIEDLFTSNHYNKYLAVERLLEGGWSEYHVSWQGIMYHVGVVVIGI